MSRNEILRPTESKQEAREKGPDYYTGQQIQPWDVADCQPYEQRIGYYKMSAIAYLMRLGLKEGTDDVVEVGKAIHYLEKLREVLKKGEQK